MNDKLQELCRTLQKQSREVLEESKQRAQHEAEQRKTLSDKMEVTVKVWSNGDDEAQFIHVKYISPLIYIMFLCSAVRLWKER